MTLATMPFEGLSIMGFPLARSIGMLVILAFLIKVLLFYRKGISINLLHIIIASLIMAVLLFSIVRNPGITLSPIAFAISIFGNIVFFIIFCHQIDEPRVFTRALIILSSSFLLSTIISLNIDASFLPIQDELSDDLGFEKTRQSGFLRNANRYSYLGLSIFWCGAVMYTLNLVSKKISLAIAFLASVAIILSMSRAAVLGLVIGIIYIFLISPNKRIIVGIFSGMTLFILLQFPLLTINEDQSKVTRMLFNRFSTETILSSGSSESRITKWLDSLESISENPLIGLPLGSMEGRRSLKTGYKINDPHNSFLFLIQYFGLVGVILILAYFAWMIRILFSDNHSQRVKYLIMTLSFSMLIPALFHTTLSWKATLIMFCIIYSIERFSYEGKLSPPLTIKRRHV